MTGPNLRSTQPLFRYLFTHEKFGLSIISAQRLINKALRHLVQWNHNIPEVLEGIKLLEGAELHEPDRNLKKYLNSHLNPSNEIMDVLLRHIRARPRWFPYSSRIPKCFMSKAITKGKDPQAVLKVLMDGGLDINAWGLSEELNGYASALLYAVRSIEAREDFIGGGGEAKFCI